MVSIRAFGIPRVWKAFLLVIGAGHLHAQHDTVATHHSCRVSTVVAANAIAYTAGIGALYQLWYKNYNNGTFHTFNDGDEWQGMDKIGHAASVYHLCRLNNLCYRWAGLPAQKAAWYATGSAVVFFTSIELMDGISQGWGFSWYDMAANVSGASLMLVQQQLWNEQRVVCKFSFVPSAYAKYNPQLLGATTMQQLFKDYNGQTYWLSANLKSLLPATSTIPSWLNIAIGYSAQGMINANADSQFHNPLATGIERQRFFYLAPDIDFTKIKTHSRFLRTTFQVLNFIKIPAPALQFGKQIKLQFKL